MIDILYSRKNCLVLDRKIIFENLMNIFIIKLFLNIFWVSKYFLIYFFITNILQIWKHSILKKCKLKKMPKKERQWVHLRAFVGVCLNFFKWKSKAYSLDYFYWLFIKTTKSLGGFRKRKKIFLICLRLFFPRQKII